MKLSNWLNNEESANGEDSLILPLELEDARPVKMQRAILRTGTALLLAATLWAGLTPIREMAVAPGLIVPRGEIRAIQHLEGGIVAEIYHVAGDEVHAGDPLIRLAGDQTGGDLGQLQSRLDSLRQHRSQIEQLIASQKHDLPLKQDGSSSLGTVQQAVLETRIDERNSEHRTLEARIAQRKSEIDNLQKEAVSLQRMVEIRTQVFNDKASLLEQGLATRRAYFDDQSALEQAKTQLVITTGRLATAQQALDEAESLFVSSDAEAQRSWSEELSKVTAELQETEEAVAKQKDRFDRLIVRTPVAGVVQVLAIKSVGEVIKPGDTFAKIVPQGVSLIAEVQIRPDDIGHVRIGDLAELKVTAFDPSIYGKLQGHIESISPSSFQRENGDYYFKASVALGTQELHGQSVVAPGMIVSAEIITGAKSFLRYILKPVLKVFDPAFSER
jgi:HlyD family secretion protein/adhesin transport system membrane fusion protein